MLVWRLNATRNGQHELPQNVKETAPFVVLGEHTIPKYTETRPNAPKRIFPDRMDVSVLGYLLPCFRNFAQQAAKFAKRLLTILKAVVRDSIMTMSRESFVGYSATVATLELVCCETIQMFFE